MTSVFTKTNFSIKHEELQKKQLKLFFAMKELYDFSSSEEEFENRILSFDKKINNSGDFYFLEFKEFQDKNVILRNFGILPMLLVTRYSNFESVAVFERIEVLLTNTNRRMSFKYYMSPLEVWLNSNSDRDKREIVEKHSSYHPILHKVFDRNIPYPEAKKEYRKSNASFNSNFDTQLKNYMEIIKDIIGEDKLSVFFEGCSGKVFQLVELLSETKNKYGLSLKPLFSRLKTELSFSLAEKTSRINYSIPTCLEDMGFNNESFIKSFYSPDNLNKNNPNFIPSILKEILTYCTDAIDDLNARNMIKVLPNAFERAVNYTFLNNATGSDSFEEIGRYLHNSNDIFVQFSYRLKMLLIGTYYRSKISLLKDVASLSATKVNSSVHGKIKIDFELLNNSQKRGVGVDITKRNSIYDDGSKFFFQILGVFWICEGYKTFDSNKFNDTDFIIPCRIVELQRQIEINKSHHFISEKYLTSKVKGVSKVSFNILREVERCTRLSLDLNKDIAFFMDTLHFNYIVTLYNQICKPNLNHAERLQTSTIKAGDVFFPSSTFKNLV